MSRIDCAVVGAGVHGLCTAFWLRRAGIDVTVVEQFAAGHDRGSSHGALRITRSSYHEASFVRLAVDAERTGWPALEQELGLALRVRTPGLFFGPPDGPFGAYLRATLGSGAAVEAIQVADARRRFPLLSIDDGDAVLLDHSAAMLLATETMRGLREWLGAGGAELLWNTAVRSLAADGDDWRLDTSAGALRAQHVVLAAGPWLPTLAPDIEPLVVQRQEVGYFDVDAPSEACAAGTFPVWARVGRDANDFQYGLPSHHGSGLKLALHRTAGPGTAPDAPPPPVDTAALLRLAGERFVVPVRSLRATERCLYTMTADQGFRVGRSPRSPSLVTIAACSGHSFKFAPVIGRMAADLVLANRRP